MPLLPEMVDALKSMAIGKSPGSDSIPLEVYLKYQEHILPILLETYHYAFQIGILPESFYDGSIVILLKLDKNSEDCSSYRPISLLNIDYEILTKILAACLNKVILDLIHADQTSCRVSLPLRIYGEPRWLLRLAARERKIWPWHL